MAADKFEPRRASPGEAFEEWDTTGKRHTMKADGKGVVRPSNAFEDGVLARRGVPIAHITTPKPRSRRKAASAAAKPTPATTPAAPLSETTSRDGGEE